MAVLNLYPSGHTVAAGCPVCGGGDKVIVLSFAGYDENENIIKFA